MGLSTARVKVAGAVALMISCLASVGVALSVPFDPPPPPASWAQATATAEPRAEPRPATGSNIMPVDYVGPQACKECHEGVYQKWSAHPHAIMNQMATPETVKADFSGVSIDYQGGKATFSREGEGFFMTLSRGNVLRKYSVTRTIGSRFMQFYVGRQLTGPEPAGHSIYTREQRLPFAYWYRRERWFPEHYFDPWGPENDADGTPKRDPFDRPDMLDYAGHCLHCHNTYAYLYRLDRDPNRPGFPADDVDFDSAEIRAELSKTIDLTGLPDSNYSDRLDPDKHLIAMGISCESCHFGSAKHAKQAASMGHFPVSDKPALHVTPTKSEDGEASWKNDYLVNSICRQCHSAKGKVFPNGAAVGNSREALDMQSGACATAIKCSDCHDPHQSIGLAPPANDPAHLQTCVRCHDKYASDGAALAHGGHTEASGVSCLDCHMPKMAQGINEAVRSHRIDSPTSPEMMSRGSINACNLCHLDKSIRWTVDQLNARWDAKITPAPKWKDVYRDLDRPLGDVWLDSRREEIRMAVVQAYSRSPLGKEALPRIIPHLEDDVPVNRVFTTIAVERIWERKLGNDDFDPAATREERAKQIAALLGQL